MKKEQDRRQIRRRFLECWLLFLLLALQGGFAWSASLRLASTNAQGEQSDSTSFNSYRLSISSNGRYIAFESAAGNLVPNDSNSAWDVFLKDLKTGTVMRVSTDALGGQSNDGISQTPSITANGRYVVFESTAGNLVPNDTNEVRDIFLKDLKTGNVTRVSTNSQGEQGNGYSSDAFISSNGRYVVFYSVASNLVPNDTNGCSDIFLKNLKTGAVTRVSTNAQGGQIDKYSYVPFISSNGRYLVFDTVASNLVPNDTNEEHDIFLKDLKTGAVTRVSTDAQGEQSNYSSTSPSITSNGRYVVFTSTAFNLVPGDTNGVDDIFLKDLKTGAVTRVSTDVKGKQGNARSLNPYIAANGRYVVFMSDASNLVPNDTNNVDDVFLKDLKTGAVTRVSANAVGEQGNGRSGTPTITANGRYVAFDSAASNLAPNDTNNNDVFVYDRKGR